MINRLVSTEKGLQVKAFPVGDSILFFPKAVKTMHGDPVLEILKRMPGVEVTDNGSVVIAGKTVSRTYVNGKLLFGDDVLKPLTEIAVEDAAGIYSYEEEDGEAEILHGKNASKRRVINVVTFKDFEKMLSGSLNAAGGVDGIALNTTVNESVNKSSAFSISPSFDFKRKLGRHSMEFSLYSDVDRSFGTSVRRDTVISGVKEIDVLSIKNGTPSYSVSPSLAFNLNYERWRLSLLTDVKYSDNSQYELAVDAFTGETDRFRSGDIDIRRADFSEKVSAAYTSGVNRLMFGLEYSGIYFNVGENLPIQNSTEKIFHSLLPSVSWSRKLSGVNTLSVNFSSSSEVTDYRNFGRWIEDTDPMSVTIGNPSLRPSSSYSLSVGERFMFKNSTSLSLRVFTALRMNPFVYDRTYYRDGTVLAEHDGYEVLPGGTY